jgi:hypothetical protein
MIGMNPVKQRQSLFSSTQLINTRKSKDKEIQGQGSSNKKVPITHVDLMKQREKLNFKNKFNEASRNSIDKHIKRISEVRGTIKNNKTSMQDAKVLSPKATINLLDHPKSNSANKPILTQTEHRKNNSSMGGSI